MNEFFTKYADSKPQDMSYMMSEPKALSGIKSFVKIEELNVYPTEEEKVLQ
ncbi:conjugal transfer protein [Bacillus toyonensis]